MTDVKRWLSPMPEKCDICSTPISTVKFFVDGKTTLGPWGIMCPSCHVFHGYGLGTGKGQKYDSKTGDKLEG